MGTRATREQAADSRTCSAATRAHRTRAATAAVETQAKCATAAWNLEGATVVVMRTSAEKRALWRLKYTARVTARDPPTAFSRVLCSEVRARLEA